MIITILVLLFLAASIAYGVKTQTHFGITKSIILGLTLCIPVAYNLIIDGLQFLGGLMLRAGFILGGEDLQSVMQSYISKKVGNTVQILTGDTSTDTEKQEPTDKE